MDERTLQAVSRALALLVSPNGVVKTLRASDACLDEDTNRLERSLNFLAKHYGHNWDHAKTVDILM